MDVTQEKIISDAQSSACIILFSSRALHMITEKSHNTRKKKLLRNNEICKYHTVYNHIEDLAPNPAVNP